MPSSSMVESLRGIHEQWSHFESLSQVDGAVGL